MHAKGYKKYSNTLLCSFPLSLIISYTLSCYLHVFYHFFGLVFTCSNFVRVLLLSYWAFLIVHFYQVASRFSCVFIFHSRLSVSSHRHLRESSPTPLLLEPTMAILLTLMIFQLSVSFLWCLESDTVLNSLFIVLRSSGVSPWALFVTLIFQLFSTREVGSLLRHFLYTFFKLN